MEVTRRSLLIGLTLAAVAMATTGFNVQLSVTPPAINYPLTEKVKMTCALDQWLLKNKLTYITSILVTRNSGNTYVASLTPHGPPNVFTDKDLLEVKGNLSGLSDNQTFLELVWTYPTKNQSGTYICEINGLDTFGRAVKKSKSLELESSAPNMDEIAEYVQLNTEKLDKVETTVMGTMMGRLDHLTEAVLSLQKKVDGASEKEVNKETGYGFRVGFVSSPVVINYPMTEKVHLRCSLEDSSADTVNQLAHIVSMSVSRSQDSSIVASVTQYESTRVFVDVDRVTATGNITGLKGTLEVTWTAPTHAQSDLYQCDVTGVTQQGHGVTLSKYVRVSTNDSTLEQLSDHIQTEHRRLEELFQKFEALSKTVSTNQKQLRLLKPHHTETGRARCTSFSKKDSTWYHQIVTTTFERPYDVIPKVTVGMVHIDTYYGGKESVVDVNVTAVNERSFTVECGTYLNNPVNPVDFSWISTN